MLQELVGAVKSVRGVVPAGLIALICAAFLAQTSEWLAVGALAVGALIVIYAMRRRAPAIDPTLEGPPRGREDVASVASEQDATTVTPPPDVDELEWVIFKNLKHSDAPQALGRRGKYTARYFVDFREACLVKSQRGVLVDLLASEIVARVNVEHFHVVAVPKSGNTLLAVGVAEKLGLAPVLVRDWPIFGQWIEGIEGSGRALLLDDAWAEGDYLVEVVGRVREAGFILTHAFLLLERSEGNVAQALHEASVTHFSAVRAMDDDDLEKLVAKVRRDEHVLGRPTRPPGVQ